MDATKPCESIGFGAMDATKPYESIGFGAMDATKPCEFIGFARPKHMLVWLNSRGASCTKFRTGNAMPT
jgi:hypothetical protein